jgi:hypothetical protein
MMSSRTLPTPTARQIFALIVVAAMLATGNLDSWLKPCKTVMADAWGFSALSDYHKQRQIERSCPIPEPPPGYRYDSDYNLAKERE